VKKTFGRFLTALLLTASCLHGDIEGGDFGGEQIADPAEHKGRPFMLKFQGDYLGKAKFKKHFDDSKIEYNESLGEFTGVFYHNDRFNEGLFAQINYNNVEMNWNRNIFFSQKSFDSIGLTLGFFSQRLCNWIWQGAVTVNIDAHGRKFTEYSNYDFFLWGRNAYSDNLGIHFGLIAWTGMKLDHVLPIIGFDYIYCDKWMFNAVFPVNLSVAYAFNKCFNVAIGARAFYNRFRVSQHENLSRGVWEYQNRGIEIGANYNWEDRVKINVHVGHAGGGRVKVCTRHNNHHKTLYFDSSAYVGGEASYSF